MERIPLGAIIEINNRLYKVKKSFNPRQAIDSYKASGMPFIHSYLLDEGIVERIRMDSDYAYNVSQGFTKTR